MSKTLLVAEKPSVGQDLARVLPGPFEKKEGFLEGPEHVITWAVGHLVQLAEPEAYDSKYKSWRMPDLPIVPERFKLVVRDERSRKQMSVVTKQLGRDEVQEVVNACDAGREGELIFAYLYEKAHAKKPVRRLWLNSMTAAAMREALGGLRPGAEFELLEEAARSRSEADWIVGMNADPGGDDPPAQLLRRRGLARARADPDARADRAPRGGDQSLPARALLARRCDFEADGERRYHGRYHQPGARAAPVGRASQASRRHGRSSRRARGARARSRSSRRKSSARKRRCSTT